MKWLIEYLMSESVILYSSSYKEVTIQKIRRDKGKNKNEMTDIKFIKIYKEVVEEIIELERKNNGNIYRYRETYIRKN